MRTSDEALPLADSHVHLSHRLFDNCIPFLKTDGGSIVREKGSRERLLAEMKACGVRFCIEPGVDPESNRRLLALAEKNRGYLFPAVGIHPTRCFTFSVFEGGRRVSKRLPLRAFRELAELAGRKEIVAIGETGLDFHLPRRKQHRARQFVWFVFQLCLAHRRKLPLILHVREADEAALRILRLFGSRIRGGVCHCFSGTPEQARRYVGLGLKLGIGAALLWDRGDDLVRTVRETPLEDILLETDAPHVRPPVDGMSKGQMKRTRNSSLVLPAVAARIAEIKGVSCEEAARITTETARRVFGLPGGEKG